MTQGVIKISQLPSASAPLADTDLTVVVQGGVTKKTPVSNIVPDPINVKAFGATGDGVTNDAPAFAAAWAALKPVGGCLLIPPGTYLLNSQWQIDIDQTAPHNYEIIGYGATLKAGAAVTGWAIKVSGSYNNFGLKIEGLQFDHRSNVTVNGCIQGMGTANLRIVKCSVEAELTKAGWAAIQLEDQTPGDGNTGCFWTLIDGFTTRARNGLNLFVAQTTATTTLTSGSDQITVAAVTGTIQVGQSVFDAASFGGEDLIPGGTIVIAQISGTTGGAGVYQLSSKALGSSTTDTLFFAKYNSYGVRMLGAQNATKIVNCSFASVVDAVRFDVGSPTPQPGWPNGDVIHANGVRVQRNDFEGVVNAIKINTDSPAIIMPTGMMCSGNRVESSYSYFNIGSNATIVADAASFTGSITAGTKVLTVASSTGTIAEGATIRGAGVNNPSVIQPYGTGGTTGTGGDGTYEVSLTAPTTLTSVAMTVSGVKTLPNHSNPPVVGPDYAVTGSADNYIVNPNYQIIYGMQSSFYGNVYNKAGGPSDYNIVAEGVGKNVVISNLSNLSAWNSAHLVLGQYHYWTDGTGTLRSKFGAPSSDTDGQPYFNTVNAPSPNEGNMLYYDATTSRWVNTGNISFDDSNSQTSVRVLNWGNGSTIAAQLTYDNTGFFVGSTGAYPVRLIAGNVERASIVNDGNVVVGTAALTTTAISGFPWIPSCPGTPTGAPTAPYTNAAAMVVDTSNNRLYVLVGGTWKYASLT